VIVSLARSQRAVPSTGTKDVIFIVERRVAGSQITPRMRHLLARSWVE
jgi:hypothetical protein